MVQKILGYDVEDRTRQDFINYLCKALSDSKNKNLKPSWLACLNPHSYVVARSDITFSDALRSADWLVPDGIGIVWVSRLIGRPVPERITGSEIFLAINQYFNMNGGGRFFFLGSTDGTLELIKARIAVEFPNIEVVGYYSPSFDSAWSSEEIEYMISAINTAKPDVLWVGMTAPKQEKWLYNNLERLNIRFAAAVGAVFDFYAGKVKRPHPFCQRLGLEWFVRLMQQPKRLWRRTVVSGPVFFWCVLAELVQSKVKK